MNPKYFMNLAKQVSTASKCKRAKYGAVLISKDGRIVSTGYNGKPRGAINDLVCYREGLLPNADKPKCCLHAEDNCITFSSPEEREGSTLFVNGVPCTDCALKIMQHQIACVYCLIDNTAVHTGNFNLDFYHKYGMKFKLFYMMPDVVTEYEIIQIK